MIPDILKEKGFLFGSRFYGVHTEESDYDYYIDEEYFDEIHQSLISLLFVFNKHPYFPHSYEYQRENIKIHLAVVPYRRMGVWHLTNRIMKTLPIHLLSNSPFRKVMFGDLLSSLTKNIKAFV